MIVAIVIIVAVTSVLITALIVSAISIRPTTPCLFAGTTVFTREGRYEGGKCSGKADNIFLSQDLATHKLNGKRICNAHVELIQDVADQLTRESK